MVNTADERRREAGLHWLRSGEEVRVGDPRKLPLPFRELAQVTADHPAVRSCHEAVTTDILCLALGDFRYTLKIWRRERPAEDIDGLLSFMTELLCRRRIEAARHDLESGTHSGMRYLVKSIFGSLNHRVLISPWIEGQTLADLPFADWTDERLANVFAAHASLLRLGLFDWNPTANNVLCVEGHDVRLFDFGYCYPFNPLLEGNSNWEERPYANLAERFETRCLFPTLLARGEDLTGDFALGLWRRAKAALAPRMRYHAESLYAMGAAHGMVLHHRALASEWEACLADPAHGEATFLHELVRSLYLYVLRDLLQHSCNAFTLEAATALGRCLREHRRAFVGDFLLPEMQGLSVDDVIILAQQRFVEAEIQMAAIAG